MLVRAPPSAQPLELFAADASRRRPRRGLSNRPPSQTAQAQQQAQADANAQHQGGLDTFKRAFSACMDAREYSVK